MKRRDCFIIVSVVAVASFTALAARMIIANLFPFTDKTGAVATFNTAGAIDESGPFFQSLGTNGRNCGSCHRIDQAMSLSSAGARAIYAQTHGKDPLFATVDGANCPTDDGRDRSSHSLLLARGLIRIGLTLPANPEFTISVMHDPYGCAILHNADTGAETISVYRRPLPTTNLRFLSTIMFDGRDTILPLNAASTFAHNLTSDLKQQALEAIQIHAQAEAPPTSSQLADIVNFELGLSTAQIYSAQAGWLSRYGAAGGPLALSMQSYYPGVNDSLGADPTGVAFNSSSMTLFTAWDRDDSAARRHEERLRERCGKK